MNNVYAMVKKFKSKYGMTIGFRLKSHSKVIEKNLNPGEEVIYAFPAQYNNSPIQVTDTCVVALTNKRILIGQKRLLWGYFFTSITPDLFNDLKIDAGFIWAIIHIDTVKEFVSLSNIDKHAATEISQNITSFMMEEKKKYGINYPKQ